MKRWLVITIAVLMLFSLAACTGQEAAAEPEQTTEQVPEHTEEPTPEPTPDWEYDEATKTLYMNVDMGAYEPDAPGFDGTTSNAPWAEFLTEIEHIVVGDDVTFIGEYALAFCSNLKSVEVGTGVNALDFRCFFKCGDFDNDSSIDMAFNSTPEFGEDVFGYTWDNPNAIIYVPDDMKEYWAEFVLQKGEMQLDGYDIPMFKSNDDVLFSMLMNPQELWSEGSMGFAENNGGEFGGGVNMGYNADAQRLEIFGEDTGACAQFNTSIMTCMSDVGMDKMPQQAVLVTFSASDIASARFSFEALDELTFSFREDGVYFVDVANFFEMPISDFLPNNLELKDDTIFNFFFAFDEEGNIRMFIWEDGFADNQAYFEYDLYQDADDINNCDLMMYVGIGANEQFNIYEYWVYTFESFMDGLPYVVNADAAGSDMQQEGGDSNGEDFGPLWTINIAGNFDIMSDMVWQSVEVQDINADGDAFQGYNLADLMDFSGNSSSKASVTFGEEGIENAIVEPTIDAYIVFMKNGEFLGGPYLLSMEGLWEYPVIEVNAD